MYSWLLCNRRRPWAGFGLLAGGLLLLVSAAGCRSPQPLSYGAGAGRLLVLLEGFRNDRGTAIVSVFAGPDGFPERIGAAVATLSLPVAGGAARAVVADLPYGEYAVSVLHDEDGDGEMAKGLFGAPREGFGFSGNPEYRFGPPAFAEASFLLLGSQREVTVVMRYETGRRQHQDEGRASGARRPQD